MFDSILSYWKSLVYVRIWKRRLVARHVHTGATFDDEPLVGVSGNAPRVAVTGIGCAGAERVINPFDHPRLMIHEFEAAEYLLGAVFREISKGRLLQGSPLVVLHPMEIPDDGMTDIEAGAFREMAEGAGARKVYIHLGRELTDAELNAGLYRDEPPVGRTPV